MAKIRLPQRRIERIKSMGGGGGTTRINIRAPKVRDQFVEYLEGLAVPPPGNAITNDSRQNVSVDV